MPKFQIVANLLVAHEFEVEADDLEDAYRSMDDMIADDFEPFETGREWQFEIHEGV